MTQLLARPAHTPDRLVGDASDAQARGVADGAVAASVGGGRYRLAELLGRGRTSATYAARDDRLGRRIAVRLFDTTVTAEALAAAAATWVPGMSRVLDAGTDVDADGSARSYLVRDLVGGVSLARLATMVECRAVTTAALGAGVATTLAALHRHGSGHGGVHAANVLIPDFAVSADWSSAAEDGVVLTDFALGDRSPHTCDPRDDIRALGTTLLSVLTGRSIVGSRTTRTSLARLGRPGAPIGIPARHRAGWTATLAAMTDVDPTARPGAVEAAAALRRLRSRT